MRVFTRGFHGMRVFTRGSHGMRVFTRGGFALSLPLSKGSGHGTQAGVRTDFGIFHLATTPPAPPPPSDPRDDAFIREVDRAYREDELRNLARRYGRWVVLAIALSLAALGGAMFWKAEQARKTGALSEQFSKALDQVDSGATTEAAQALTEIGASNNPSYRALATFTEAGIALNGGDIEKAGSDLRRIADDPDVAEPLRQAATMKLLRLEFDTISPQEVLKRAAPFVEGDSPWFPIAGEMAALAHMKAGDTQRAGALFFRIASDQRSPLSLRARAEQMAATLGQDVTKIAEAQARAREAGATAAANAAAEAPVAEWAAGQ